MTLLVGIDENGLGARLGPLLVTGVMAQADEGGQRFLSRKLPKSLRADLDDSKALVSNKDFKLGEAWARVVAERAAGHSVATPEQLLQQLSLDTKQELRAPCPKKSERQCFSVPIQRFSASDELLERIREHEETLRARGVTLLTARSQILCTGRLNSLKADGISRFSADLHAMERLVLAFHAQAAQPLKATLGKVGGMGQYGKFFGPLSNRLHSVLKEGQEESSYHFPELGELRFLRDADAKAPLVMLASLIGKYLREVLTARIAEFYFAQRDFSGDRELDLPSGYHDPVTERFAVATQETRKRLSIVDDCFERVTNEKLKAESVPRKKKKSSSNSGQTSLF